MSWIRQLEEICNKNFSASSRKKKSHKWNQTRLIHLFVKSDLVTKQPHTQCLHDKSNRNAVVREAVNKFICGVRVSWDTATGVRAARFSRKTSTFYRLEVVSPLGTSCNAIKRFFLGFCILAWLMAKSPFEIFLNAFIASICKPRNDFLFFLVICYSWLWLFVWCSRVAEHLRHSLQSINGWLRDHFHLILFATGCGMVGKW